MNAPDPAAADADAHNMVSIALESNALFSDEGQQRAFAPGAATHTMPGLRQQRKALKDCDVLFKAADRRDIWAHRFVLAARYPPCQILFTVPIEAVAQEQEQSEQEWIPPILVTITDMNGDMLELLVDHAYYVPLQERIGYHNVREVLEMAEKHKVSKIRNHCINFLERHLDVATCIDTYRLAASRGYKILASEAFDFLVRHFHEVGNETAQLLSLTPDQMRALLADDRLDAPNVEFTFRAVLKWISADVENRQKLLAHFLPLLRFKGCTLTDMEKVVANPVVQADQNCRRILRVIHQLVVTSEPGRSRRCTKFEAMLQTWGPSQSNE